MAANPSKDSLSNVAGSYWMEVDCCFSSGADGEWNREKCVRVLMNDEFVLFMSLLTHTRFPGSWLTIFPAFENDKIDGTRLVNCLCQISK